MGRMRPLPYKSSLSVTRARAGGYACSERDGAYVSGSGAILLRVRVRASDEPALIGLVTGEQEVPPGEAEVTEVCLLAACIGAYGALSPMIGSALIALMR